MRRSVERQIPPWTANQLRHSAAEVGAESFFPRHLCRPEPLVPVRFKQLLFSRHQLLHARFVDLEPDWLKFALNPDELSPVQLAEIIQPVGEYQPQ